MAGLAGLTGSGVEGTTVTSESNSTCSKLPLRFYKLDFSTMIINTAP